MPFSIPVRRARSHRDGRLAFFMMSALFCASAMAADGNAPAEIDARYQRERAACERNQGQQDRGACLREAAAARDAARRGELDAAQSVYEQNAVARCDALPEADRELCRRRVRGEGVTQGSVDEGGIYREYREMTLPSVAPGDGAQ